MVSAPSGFHVPQFLVSFNTSKLPIAFCDFLVIGSGIAGISSALECSKNGTVKLLAKRKADYNNTHFAQGGIACPFSTEDSEEMHVVDTLNAGRGISNEHIVRLIVARAKECISDLIAKGMRFDLNSAGEFDLTCEGGHSKTRILHAMGDSTGAAIESTLLETAKASPGIDIIEDCFALDLLVKDGVCYGAIVFDSENKKYIIFAQRTIISTGGYAQIYRETTNPDVTTGDGVAMAFRAGAEIADMEFVQFHPTTLYIAGASRFLISETIRGEGGLLKDKFGRRFMPDYHSDAELAPRDVVSRSIIDVMRLTNSPLVYIDITHIDACALKARFPQITKACADFGLDISRDLIPVRPSAHYTIGGIKTNEKGETNIAGLYACGESASTRFHGANRLGSNSLLEGLVMGKLTAENASLNIEKKNKLEFPVLEHYRKTVSKWINVWDVSNSLKSLMWRNVGLERDNASLEHALKDISYWGSYVMNEQFNYWHGWELQNMLITAYFVTSAAVTRKESRGVHYRTDFPNEDTNFLNHYITFKTTDSYQ